jgi:hypothetical protein
MFICKSLQKKKLTYGENSQLRVPNFTEFTVAQKNASKFNRRDLTMTEL